MGHIGNLDVDLFITEHKIYLLEMNARLGGGYPFSHLAGIHFPKALIKWAEGEQADSEFGIKQYNQIIHKDIQFVNLSGIADEGGDGDGSKNQENAILPDS